MEETQSENKKSFNPMLLVVAGIIILAGGAYVLSSHKSAVAPAPQTTQQPTAPAAMHTTSAAMKAETTMTVEGGNYFFKPNVITVKKGDKVKITFSNSGGFHDFVIDEYNVKTATIPSNKTAMVEFTADKVGTFAYYCSVGSHRAMGMEGKLIVQ